jgi:type II secretory pathway pseudopilin PulG
MRNPRSGFALLFVLAMAAVIAVMLYMAMPRVAFEAQRDKEQLLIDRGEQYSRAVNLFVRKFNRYPADFDALQNTQNLRFLRKQYVDPFTGKQEWRIIHVGPGGVFTDSLVYNKKTDDSTKPEQQTFITEMQQIGGTPVDPNAPTGVNMATRQRPSDQPGAPGSNLGATGGNNFPPQIDASGQPVLSQPGAAGAPAIPGALAPNSFPPQFDANGQPIQPSVPGSPQSPVPLPPGIGLPPGVALPPGVQSETATQQMPQQQQPNGPPTSAANLINQLLTSPRPGGLPGFGGPQTGSTLGGPAAPAAVPTAAPAAAANAPQTIGGGIAGIASKIELRGIKIYKDKKKYNEWEFVYDISKDPTRTAVAPQAAPAPGTTTTTGATTTTPTTTPTSASTMTTPPPPPPPAATPTQ